MRDPYRQGDTGQRLVESLLLRLEGQGDKSWPQFGHADPERPRDPMPQVGSAKFGKGESTCGHNDSIRREGSPRRDDLEVVPFYDLLHTASAECPHTGITAFSFQHGDDLPGTAVAELLAEFLLVIGDAVLLHEGYEIPRGVAGQGRLAEVRVSGEVVRGGCVDVREVAAPAAGDLDLATHTFVVLEQQDTFASVCRREGTEKPGASAADHDHVLMLRWFSAHFLVMTQPKLTVDSRGKGGRELLGVAATSGFNHSVRRFTTILCIACSVFSLRAEISLAPIFSDHMVIQQGVTLPVWGTAAPGETVIVTCAGREERTVADGSGSWRLTLRPISFTGKTCELIVNGSNRIEIQDILPGDVWIAAGEAEMTAPLSNSVIGSRAASISDLGMRFYVRDSSGKSHWVAVSTKTSPTFPAVPFFFARDLRASRKIPIGVIDCTTTLPAPIDAWISTSGLTGLAPLNRPGTGTGSSPSRLFQSLIKPLSPFAITGVIWDQGASDEGDHALRHRLFLAHLIRDWRRIWEQGPFPFIILLPPGNGSPDASAVESYLGDHGAPRRAWPWIREGIVSALRLPNTGIASAIDLADEDTEFDSLVAGRRLALTARHMVYGEELAYTGPVFRNARIEQSRMRLYFEGGKDGLTMGSTPGSGEAKGLKGFSVSSSLKGFALRGKEGRWFPAEARIDGETVLLSSDAVPKPVAARYNWKSLPLGNLYDRAGLPAPPFRTDSDQPSEGNPRH